MKVLIRENYLALLRREKNRQSLKLISGMRGCGKTAVVAIYAKECQKEGGNVLYLDLSDKKNEPYLKVPALLSYCYAHYDKTKRNYLFLEGLETFPDFEELCNKLYRQRRFDPYLISSIKLSSPPACRSHYLEIRPFSYHEFLKASKGRNEERSLERYIRYGGCPALLDEKVFARKGQYAKKIFKSLLDRLILHEAVKYEELLRPLALYMCEKDGEELSCHAIALELSERTGKSYNHHTVRNYLDFLEKSHFLTKVSRFEMRKGKKGKTRERYILTDPLLTLAYGYGEEPFTRKSFINLIMRELMNKGLEVSVARVYGEEVGIYAYKGKGKMLIAFVDDPNTEAVDEAIEKLHYARVDAELYILTALRRPLPKRESAKVMSLYDWLLIERKRG